MAGGWDMMFKSLLNAAGFDPDAVKQEVSGHITALQQFTQHVMRELHHQRMEAQAQREATDLILAHLGLERPTQVLPPVSENKDAA